MGKYNSSVYDESIVNSGRVKAKRYTKTQSKMTTIALLVAGLGFLFIGLLGIGFQKLISLALTNNSAIGDTIWIIVGFSSILSIVLYFVWMFKVTNASLGFQLFTILLFCITNGYTFGALFIMVNASEIIIAFAGTGLTLIISYIVAKLMSFKAAMSLGRMIMIISFVYLGLILMSLIGSAFSIFNPFGFGLGYSSFFSQWIYSVTLAISGILSVLFITYNLWMLQNQDKFYGELSPKESRNIAIFFGFLILMNLLRIFYLLVSFLFRLKNN